MLCNVAWRSVAVFVRCVCSITHSVSLTLSLSLYIYICINWPCLLSVALPRKGSPASHAIASCLLLSSLMLLFVCLFPNQACLGVLTIWNRNRLVFLGEPVPLSDHSRGTSSPATLQMVPQVWFGWWGLFGPLSKCVLNCNLKCHFEMPSEMQIWHAL